MKGLKRGLFVATTIVCAVMLVGCIQQIDPHDGQIVDVNDFPTFTYGFQLEGIEGSTGNIYLPEGADLTTEVLEAQAGYLSYDETHPMSITLADGSGSAIYPDPASVQFSVSDYSLDTTETSTVDIAMVAAFDPQTLLPGRTYTSSTDDRSVYRDVTGGSVFASNSDSGPLFTLPNPAPELNKTSMRYVIGSSTYPSITITSGSCDYNLPAELNLKTEEGFGDISAWFDIEGSDGNWTLTLKSGAPIDFTTPETHGVELVNGAAYLAFDVVVDDPHMVDPANNSIFIPSPILAHSQFVFSAHGDNQEPIYDQEGDWRCIPIRWASDVATPPTTTFSTLAVESGTFTFDGSEYLATATASSAGAYDMEVGFEYERFDGTDWIGTDEVTTETVTYTVSEAAQPTTQTVTPSTTSRGASTGDPMSVGFAGLALLGIASTGVALTRKRMSH